MMIRAATWAVSAAMGVGAAGLTVAHEPNDPGSTWFVTCDTNGRDHATFGGRLIPTPFGAVELIGPAAETRSGAIEASRAFGAVLGGDCEPTHATEVWRVSAPRMSTFTEPRGSALTRYQQGTAALALMALGE